VKSSLRLLGALLLAVTTLVVLANPVAAHTGFESSDPSDDSTVDQPIEIITLVFSGEAEPTGDGFQILDSSGAVREPTQATTVDGLTWTLRFDPALVGGTVGVRWMVKAPDAHPIEGSFSFTTTAPSAASDVDGVASDETAQASAGASLSEAPAEAAEVDLDSFLATDAASTAVAQQVGAAARVVTLIGTLIGVGALVFAAAVLRGHHRDVAYVLYWVRRAGILVVLGATAELVAQVAVEDGGDWTALSSPSTVAAVVTAPFGIAVALRIAGGLALTSGADLCITPAEHAPDPVVAIRELVGVGAGSPHAGGTIGDDVAQPALASGMSEPYVHQGDHAWRPTIDSGWAIAGALALVGSHLFDGHTVTKGSRFWTGFADVVHVAGGAVWAGGVLMLVAVLWRRHRRGHAPRSLQLAMRFSVVATLALVVVGVAGLALTVIVLDSPSELWATEWGRTLLVKTLLVAAAASVGGYNHKVLIPAMERAGDHPDLALRFRLVVSAEAVALVGVVIATALLMGAASQP
jgi:copper transport protein